MKETIKNEWVAALRSGDYPQARDGLRRSKDVMVEGNVIQAAGYCCLGILCEISGLAEWEEGENTHIDNGMYYAGDWDVLPPQVLAWAEMKAQSSRYLARLNDSGRTFDAIADVIEENWGSL